MECSSAEQPWSVLLLSSRGVFFWRAENRGGLVLFFPEQKICSSNFFVAAEQPDLYADWVRSSSICFFDLRLDLPINFIHYI